ncbi:nuclear receptor subfamily 1 group D member 2-like [Embiotoca jacksoni]|uniref:nuclear receptor subfamily 1 group D member 2-like n=1 Tax=Embiotoca jacksoni TaxID=100190 RepID=UPI003703D256
MPKGVLKRQLKHFKAVRFGRIPKREKQRMLLEMQNAMNNMMSNNSQLHSMLHGHQSPPLPMEAMTGDASASPSSSSSSSSAASESPSCSNPSSTQCAQDSESVVSMDTNSSSASSCGSDSGEDEAVVAVSRQHQGAFAFGQQRSARRGQATPSPVAPETGAEGRTEEEQRQESWNCWNNNNAAAGGYRHKVYSGGQHVTNSAYREDRGVYQQQQLSSAPSCEPSEDSQRQHDFNTQTASCGYRGPTGCVSSRAHLVCPMNTSPYVDPRKPSQEIWEEFSMSFTPAVREVVEFAKRIPGFRDLPEHDQVSLLKAGTFEVLMVRFASLFNVAERTVTFLSGKRYSLDTLRSLGAGELLNSMCEFSEKLAALRLDADEMSLFTAVVLVSADRSGIQDLNPVEALQDRLIRALRNLVMQNHGDESATTFTKLLLKLPELRSLNNVHSEELLSFKVHP